MVFSRFLNGVECATTEAVTHHRPEKEESVMNITTVGLDLAKNVFHLVGLRAREETNSAGRSKPWGHVLY